MAKRILFIEDEDDMVSLMRLRLEAAGYEFISAADGEEGVNKVYSEKPDLVLLDIILPKMDGYDVCRKLKADPGVRHIPVIVVSASGGKDLQKKCADAGADGVIIKPFDAKELLDRIKGAIA
jgi:DNA-binding response OmpR family regulator